MKILLVKPDSRLDTIRRLDKFLLLEPLELELLAAAVPDGHEIEILDMGTRRFATRAFVQALKRMRPDVIGLTAYTHQSRRALVLARIARSICPEARIVLGGHHATLMPEDYNQSFVHYVVRGEGCRPFRALIEAFADGRDGDGIEGVLRPGPDYERQAKEPIPAIGPLNELPAPRRDLVDRKRYFSAWSKEGFDIRKGDTLFPRVASMRTSLGCAFRCKFCVVPYVTGGKYLQLSPEETVDAIEAIEESHIYLVDDETFLNVERMTRIAELLKERGVDKKFVGWARSSTVVEHPEMFQLWGEVGLEIVYIGFEAAVDEMLKDVNKRSSVENNNNAHCILREAGIATHAAFMAASNWSDDDFDLLEDYVSQMEPAEITFTIYTPSPGTPNWEEEKADFIANPIALHDCMHALFETTLPLKKFYERFARLSKVAEKRNPLRVNRSPVSPIEIIKVVWAGMRYRKALRRAWRDHDLTV